MVMQRFCRKNVMRQYLKKYFMCIKRYFHVLCMFCSAVCLFVCFFGIKELNRWFFNKIERLLFKKRLYVLEMMGI